MQGAGRELIYKFSLMWFPIYYETVHVYVEKLIPLCARVHCGPNASFTLVKGGHLVHPLKACALKSQTEFSPPHRAKGPIQLTRKFKSAHTSQNSRAAAVLLSFDSFVHTKRKSPNFSMHVETNVFSNACKRFSDAFATMARQNKCARVARRQ